MNVFEADVCARSYRFDGPITSEDVNQLGDARMIVEGQCAATQLAQKCHGHMDVKNGVIRRILYWLIRLLKARGMHAPRRRS